MFDNSLPDVFSCLLVKARKVHRCYECQREICPGSRYYRISGKWDGEFDTFSICRWCESVRDLWGQDKTVEGIPGYGQLAGYQAYELYYG